MALQVAAGYIFSGQDLGCFNKYLWHINAFVPSGFALIYELQEMNFQG